MYTFIVHIFLLYLFLGDISACALLFNPSWNKVGSVGFLNFSLIKYVDLLSVKHWPLQAVAVSDVVTDIMKQNIEERTLFTATLTNKER